MIDVETTTVTPQDRWRVIDHEQSLGWPSRERVVLADSRGIEAFPDGYTERVRTAAVALLLATRAGFTTDLYQQRLTEMDELLSGEVYR